MNRRYLTNDEVCDLLGGPSSEYPWMPAATPAIRVIASQGWGLQLTRHDETLVGYLPWDQTDPRRGRAYQIPVIGGVLRGMVTKD
jgi:hypothetical protein